MAQWKKLKRIKKRYYTERLAFLFLSSCGSYQNSSNYDSDGVYSSTQKSNQSNNVQSNGYQTYFNSLQVTEVELTEYLVRTSQRYGMAPEQFAQELQKAGQIQQLVAEVARAKALAGVLSRISIKDASGAAVDLEALAPKPAATPVAE